MHFFSDFDIQYQAKVLENKSEIYFLRRKGFPVHIQACIKAGTRYNNVSGLSHFLEHLLLVGTKSYPSKFDMALALEKVGGYFDATTDADFIRITVSVPREEHARLAISILNEILTASLFLENTFKNEQEVILREQSDRYNDNSLLLSDTFMERVYPDFELHFKNLGTADSVSKIELNDIIKFFKTNITAERTSFIVSGDFTVDIIEKDLSSIILPRDSGDFLPELISSQNKQKIIYKNINTKNNDLFLGCRCDVNDFQEIIGLSMLQQMFMGRGNLLMQELRYKRGLVYGGSVLFWNFTNTSIFGFRTTCAKDKTIEVFDVVLNILNEVYLNGISELECEKLKIKIDSHYRFNLQSSRQWLDIQSFVLRHSAQNKIDILDIFLQIQNMNHFLLTDIFRKYFNQNSMYGVVLGELSDDMLDCLDGLL